MKNISNISAENFMDELIEKIESRLKKMKKYADDEGIRQIPMEKLEQSPRFEEFICNFSIGFVTRKWSHLNRNKKSCAEFLEIRERLFGEKSATLTMFERDELWRKFLCLRYKTLLQIPDDWRKREAFSFYNECVRERSVDEYFKFYVDENSALRTKYQEKENIGGKELQKWISYVYKTKVPEEVKNKTKHHILNDLFLHYRQARIKLDHYDRNIGFTAPSDGYCLKAITDILYKMARVNNIADNLPKDDVLPEIFVNELKNNSKTKKYLHRCGDNLNFDDLVAKGMKKGALVFLVDDGDIRHTMFWSGSKNKSGEAELIGFNSEESGVKIAKTPSGKNKDLWVFDLHGFIAQELSAQKALCSNTISRPTNNLRR